MILLDDNFSTIQESIKQGRTIFKNIRNFVTYLLTSNFAEVFVIFLASLFGYLPITAAQLLWINLLTDGFPALALGSDPVRLHTMKEKPRKNEAILTKKVLAFILSIGSISTLILLFIFFILRKDLIAARSALFTGFVLFELVKIAVIRYQDKLKLFSNKWLILTVITSILLQLLVLYTPLNKLFRTAPLTIEHWILLIGSIAFAWLLSMFISRVLIKVNH